MGCLISFGIVSLAHLRLDKAKAFCQKAQIGFFNFSQIFIEKKNLDLRKKESIAKEITQNEKENLVNNCKFLSLQ